jgi:hypothetical protein
MMYRCCDSSVDTIFQFKSFTPKMFFHIRKQPVITCGEIWRIRRKWNTSQPYCCTRFCTSWWQCDSALSWSKMKSCSSSSDCVPHPARVCSNIGHWQLYKLAQDGQVQLYILSKTWCAWLSEHPDCIVLFFFLGDIWTSLPALSFQLRMKWMLIWLINH